MTSLRERMLEELCRHNYAPRTRENYVSQIAKLARHFGTSPDGLTWEQVAEYQDMITEQRVSWLPQAVAALQFFYNKVLQRDWKIEQSRRPKSRSSAEVFTPEEVSRLLASAEPGKARMLINAHHVRSTWEFAVWINCISVSLWASSLVGLHYAALEPAVRRHWPEVLISWSRMMGGRFTDPKVGADILMGVLAATGMCILTLTLEFLEGQGVRYYSPLPLLGVLPSIGHLIGGLIGLSLFILEATFALVIVKVVLRKKSFALGFGVLFYGLVFCLLSESATFLLPLTLAKVGLVVLVFARHGVLGAIALMFSALMLGCTLTIDPARPYFAGAMVYLTVLLALAAFAFVTAIGGWRRLLNSQPNMSGV